MRTESPDWFTRACSTARDEAFVWLDGRRIAYHAWGEPGLPVVVLVHGGAAHAGWWDHVAPHLAEKCRVLAVDLSGHGESSHEAVYSIERWADEVIAVAAAESADPPILLGHSMGGLVVLAAAARSDVQVRGVAAIDTAAEGTGSGEVGPGPRPLRTHHRTYETLELAVSRFRTLPIDGASLPFVRDHLAKTSLRQVPRGWTWKFDPHIMSKSPVGLVDIRPARCAAAIVRGERGLTTPESAMLMARRVGPDVPMTTILDAGHHIMLDQPVALIATLQTLLGQWDLEARTRHGARG